MIFCVVVGCVDNADGWCCCCFCCCVLAVAVISIVLVLLKSVVMAFWRDIVTYNHPIKSTYHQERFVGRLTLSV